MTDAALHEALSNNISRGMTLWHEILRRKGLLELDRRRRRLRPTDLP